MNMLTPVQLCVIILSVVLLIAIMLSVVLLHAADCKLY